MSELLGWMILLGLAATVGCIVMIASRIERHARCILDAMLQSNELNMSRLDERFASPSQPPVSSSGAERAKPIAQIPARAVEPERRAFPRRRLEDLFPSQRAKRYCV